MKVNLILTLDVNFILMEKRLGNTGLDADYFFYNVAPLHVSW
jgi:hypothetical protein